MSSGKGKECRAGLDIPPISVTSRHTASVWRGNTRIPMLLAIAMGPPLPSEILSTDRRRAAMKPSVSADDHLVQAACAGNADAFTEIIVRHKGRVFGMAG